MNLIFDVLEELMYFINDEFEVAYESNGETKKVIVTPFISKEYTGQVYLTLSCKNAFLNDFTNTDLVKKVAFNFRRKDYHKAEMDKNTTLLILSEHDVDEAIDSSAKVKIEDDPYYFKKYVFSFSETSKKYTETWIEQSKKENSLVGTIQNYITNTGNFRRYKENNRGELIYTYLVELITKIPSFPMKTAKSQELLSVEQYLNDAIESLKSEKNSLVLKRSTLDKLVDTDKTKLNMEMICELWEQSFLCEG